MADVSICAMSSNALSDIRRHMRIQAGKIRDGLQKIPDRARFDRAPHRFLRCRVRTSDHERSVLCGVQYIPHLRLAGLPVFVLTRVVVVRVHLHGKIVRRVDQLHENRQFARVAVALAEV